MLVSSGCYLLFIDTVSGVMMSEAWRKRRFASINSLTRLSWPVNKVQDVTFYCRRRDDARSAHSTICFPSSPISCIFYMAPLILYCSIIFLIHIWSQASTGHENNRLDLAKKMSKSLIEKVWINFTLIFILGSMFFFLTLQCSRTAEFQFWNHPHSSRKSVLVMVQPVGTILGGAGSDCCTLALKTTEKTRRRRDWKL